MRNDRLADREMAIRQTAQLCVKKLLHSLNVFQAALATSKAGIRNSLMDAGYCASLPQILFSVSGQFGLPAYEHCKGSDSSKLLPATSSTDQGSPRTCFSHWCVPVTGFGRLVNVFVDPAYGRCRRSTNHRLHQACNICACCWPHFFARAKTRDSIFTSYPKSAIIIVLNDPDLLQLYRNLFDLTTLTVIFFARVINATVT